MTKFLNLQDGIMIYTRTYITGGNLVYNKDNFSQLNYLYYKKYTCIYKNAKCFDT